jgi:hypothetical protein
MLTEKFAPSFTFGYEATILKVKHKLQALCMLKDDGLYNAKNELLGYYSNN